MRAVHTRSLVNSRDSSASCSAFSGAALNTQTIAAVNKCAAGSAPQKMIARVLQWGLPQQTTYASQSFFVNSITRPITCRITHPITHPITRSVTHPIAHLIAWQTHFGAFLGVPLESDNSSTDLSYRRSVNRGQFHILSLGALVQAPAARLRPCRTACQTDNSCGDICPARMAKAPHETDCPSPAGQPRPTVITPIAFKPVSKSTDENSIKKPAKAGFLQPHTGL